MPMGELEDNDAHRVFGGCFIEIASDFDEF
jgi:hypothetical protein